MEVRDGTESLTSKGGARHHDGGRQGGKKMEEKKGSPIPILILVGIIAPIQVKSIS
jgi:hypothetical protein